MRTCLLLLCASLAAICGCGTPGAPQPPSLEIPKPVTDLKAVRKGDTVTLTWTVPEETTDGILIRKRGKMLVHRILPDDPGSTFNTLPAPGSSAQAAPLAQLPLLPALDEKKAEQASYQDSVTPLIQSQAGSDFVRYTIIAVNSSSRGAGQGNVAEIPLVPALPAPQSLLAETVSTGVRLTWDAAPLPSGGRLNPTFSYRIMRLQDSAKAAEPVLVKQVGLPPSAGQTLSYVDTSIEWESHYQYWVTPITSWQGHGRHGEVQGDDSPVASVLAHDIFPPTTPVGVQAVFSGAGQKLFIDLSWTPNSEDDLAGYNIYRRTEGEQAVKINSDLVKTPAFRDNSVQLGTRYFYAVTAVDLRGNESEKSQETSETVPRE